MTTTPVHTITDEQIAEIEKSALDKKSEGFLLTHNLSCDGLIALVARLREAEKDAARLEYMISEQCVVQWQNGCGSPVVYSLAWPQLGEIQAEWHATPRAAIDTAMQEKSQ